MFLLSLGNMFLNPRKRVSGKICNELTYNSSCDSTYNTSCDAFDLQHIMWCILHTIRILCFEFLGLLTRTTNFQKFRNILYFEQYKCNCEYIFGNFFTIILLWLKIHNKSTNSKVHFLMLKVHEIKNKLNTIKRYNT